MATVRKQVERLDDFLTIGEAAEYLGVSASTLRNWDRTDKVKAARHPVNGYRLYRRQDLDRILGGLQGSSERGRKSDTQ